MEANYPFPAFDWGPVSTRIKNNYSAQHQTVKEDNMRPKRREDPPYIQPKPSRNRRDHTYSLYETIEMDHHLFSIPILMQPETRPISHDQLVAEVKGIYAGLTMVEAKCINMDETLTSRDVERQLTDSQWQALIALHKTLLHEHHDFFLASRHPSASSKLEDTRIKCLRDISRYWMAIYEDRSSDREICSSVSRFWYGNAADKNPTTGRLYHHLALLVRPHIISQLFLYNRSLMDKAISERVCGSIKTLVESISKRGSHYVKSGSSNRGCGISRRPIITNAFLRWALFFASFSHIGMGISTPPRRIISMNNDWTSSKVTTFTDLAIVLLVIFVLGVAQVLVVFKRKPLPVWATLMTCSAFGWWCIRSDSINSLSLTCAVFFVWIISSYQYARKAFENLKAPVYIPLITIGMAIALDVLIVRYMTPIEAAISQVDLINLSLPSTSLVLATTAIGLSIYQRRLPEPLRLEHRFTIQEMP